jgi:hypothetical protein
VRKEGAAFPMHLLTSPIADLKKGMHSSRPLARTLLPPKSIKESESLERIRTKVKRLVQYMTANFMVTLDQLAEMDSKSSKHIREKFKEIVILLTENLDLLFFDLIDRHRSCYACESDALHECMRCNRDVCDMHVIFAETEYEEPLTYCHECFWEAAEDDPY